MTTSTDGAGSHSESPKNTPDTTGKTILFMDDDDLVRTLAKAMLEHQGYTVLLAADGAEGLDIFRREKDRIGLAIVDLTMPVMSGDEVLRAIRKIRPGIPVIITSGFDPGSIREQTSRSGDADILLKPFTIQAFTAAVEKALTA